MVSIIPFSKIRGLAYLRKLQAKAIFPFKSSCCKRLSTKRRPKTCSQLISDDLNLRTKTLDKGLFDTKTIKSIESSFYRNERLTLQNEDLRSMLKQTNSCDWLYAPHNEIRPTDSVTLSVSNFHSHDVQNKSTFKIIQ